MSRQLRIEFAGALYHVMSRGNNREPIIHNEDDVVAFFESLESTCHRYAWRVFAWCVMPNHYHLVIETQRPTLSAGMRRHNSCFAQQFNKRHGRIGHVFQGRFKAFIIAQEQYLLTVLRYVELNPCRSGLVQHPEEWPWSSARVSLGITSPPAWSAVREMWSRFGTNPAVSALRYRAFLVDGMRDAKAASLNHRGVLIGENNHLSQFHAGRSASAEVPKRERIELPTLNSIFAAAPDTDGAIKAAYGAGFTLRAISNHIGVHYSTISLIARRTTPRKRGSFTASRAAARIRANTERRNADF